MGVSIFCLFLFFIQASARRMAEEPTPSPPTSTPTRSLTGTPAITITVAGIASIFSITFILLLYAQRCKNGGFGANSRDNLPLSRVDSGVNRNVIQQLPLFRFSSLRGHKDGLDCSVCLTRFESEEVLRLLPKCRHAFHVDCVDTWLDQHSTCPLCRYRVRPEDILLLDCQGSQHKALYNYDSGRGSRHSSAGERSRRVYMSGSLPRRRSFDNWSSRRRKASNTRSGLLSGNTSRREQGVDKHRVEHQIVVSDGVNAAAKEQSDLTEEEVFYLRTEMLLGDGRAADVGAAGLRKSRSDIFGEKRREGKEEEGIARRLMDWIPQFQQPKPAATSSSSSSSSSSSGIV